MFDTFHKERKRLERIPEYYRERETFNYTLAKYGALTVLRYARGRSLLELGCGTGIMTEEFSKRFSRILAIDGSEQNIKVANKYVKTKTVEFKTGLFEQLQIAESFDNIVMASILEHIRSPINILRKFRKNLGRSGNLHIIIPNAASLHRRIGLKKKLIRKLTALQGQDYEIGHRRYYTLDALEKSIVKAGFSINCVEGIILKPYPNTEMEILPESCIQTLYKVGKSIPEYCAQLYVCCKP